MRSVSQSCRRAVEGWMEREETNCTFIDPCILNEGKGVELHQSHLKYEGIAFLEKLLHL